MDPAALDKLYNNRAAVPDHPAHIARWQKASEEARAKLSPRLDLTYGAHPLETLNFFPAQHPGRPIVVFIHGGYWQAMDKADCDFVALGLGQPLDANVANLNYPLGPEARMDRIAASLRRALLWLWREAAALGADGTRIYVTGHSAGGHMAALAALTDWRALDARAPADLVKGGLAISGIYDLQPIRQCYLNDRLRLDIEEAERNSPLALLRQPRAYSLPPLAFAVGEIETEAFHQQQSDFVKVFASIGNLVTAVTYPGCHHFDILHPLGQPGSALQQPLAQMLAA